MYVPDLNDIPIEENNAGISQEEIKDAFLKFGKCRKPHKKKTQKVKWLHILSSRILYKIFIEQYQILVYIIN